MKVSIKASIVLIAIALVSGLLLSVLNGLLYVSDEEKDNRKLGKVYASDVVARYMGDDLSRFGNNIENESYGKVTGVYECADEAVIIKARGIGGYSSGWVECYVAIKDSVIKKVVVNDNNNQSFIGNIKEKWLDAQFADKSTDEPLVIGLDVQPSSGASKSSNAINNSVNMAMYLYNKEYAAAEMDEDEAELLKIKEKVCANVQEKIEIKEGFSNEKAELAGVWSAGDNAYVVKVKGLGGYDNGWVEVYVAVKQGKVEKVVINRNSGQTELGKFSQNVLDDLYAGKAENEYDGIISGATMTSQAIKNAVNAALKYLTYLEEE